MTDRKDSENGPDSLEVPEPTAEHDEEIRKKIEDDLRKKGILDPPPKVPVRLPCLPGQQHNWQFLRPFVDPITKSPMALYRCSKCKRQGRAPVGQQPPP